MFIGPFFLFITHYYRSLSTLPQLPYLRILGGVIDTCTLTGDVSVDVPEPRDA